MTKLESKARISHAFVLAGTILLSGCALSHSLLDAEYSSTVNSHGVDRYNTDHGSKRFYGSTPSNDRSGFSSSSASPHETSREADSWEVSRIVADNVRVRSGPGLDYPVISQFPKGKMILSQTQDIRGWRPVIISYPKKGWVWGAYLVEAPTQPRKKLRYRGKDLLQIGEDRYIGPDGTLYRSKREQAPESRSTEDTSDWRSPLSVSAVTDVFGVRRIHPVNGSRDAFHTGVDLHASHGTPVLAAASGRVREVFRDSYLGLTVELEHEMGFRTRYAHLSKVFVQEGQRISTGEELALSGNSGKTTGPHLHFELWKGGRPVNPAQYIDFRR